MLLIVPVYNLCLLQLFFINPCRHALSLKDFPLSTEKISILKKPRDTVRPLCAARLLAMGINSNGSPREMRGDRREEEEEEARGRDPDDQ